MVEKKLAPKKDKAAVKKNDKKKPNIFKRIGRFFKECYSELKKVTWPTPKEWLKFSLAVLAFLLVMAVLVGVLDFGMSELLKLIAG